MIHASTSTPPRVAMSGLGAARGGVPLWLPLPFLLAGATGAAIFGLLLPLVAPLALTAYNEPHVLALVHIATLGWLTMIIMGASMQLAPVILLTPLRAARLARAQFPIYLTGVILLVSGFWFQRTPLLIVGGSIVVAAVAHYVVIMAATLWRATSRPLTAWYLTASICYLSAVVSLGLTMALNLQFGFLSAPLARLLLAHITLGVVGWLTCTLVGVSYTLIRMFALVHEHDDILGRRIFALLNIGTVGMALCAGFGWRPLEPLFGCALVCGVWTYGYDVWRMMKLRRRRSLEVTQWHTFAAVSCLCLVLSLGVCALLFGWRGAGVSTALALTAFVGWLGQSTVGYLYKIVPFLTWQSRYAPLVGKTKIPLMRDLIHERWARASFWLMNGGLLVAVLCALQSWRGPLQLASAAIGVGLALALANVVGAVLPKRLIPRGQ